MAKLQNPLGSTSAKGSLGKKITYYQRGSTQRVRQFSKPTDAQSPGQIARRVIFRDKIDEWLSLIVLEKTTWREVLIKKAPLSFYNLFLSIPEYRYKVHVYGRKKFGQQVFGVPHSI